MIVKIEWMKMIERKFDSATKNKIKETVPFSNGSYDFTSIFGENTFWAMKALNFHPYNEINKTIIEFIWLCTYFT